MIMVKVMARKERQVLYVNRENSAEMLENSEHNHFLLKCEKYGKISYFWCLNSVDKNFKLLI